MQEVGLIREGLCRKILRGSAVGARRGREEFEQRSGVVRSEDRVHSNVGVWEISGTSTNATGWYEDVHGSYTWCRVDVK